MAMNAGMKMMMMDKVRKGEQYPRSEYGGASGRRMIGYDRDETENRRQRDSRGRYMEGGGSYNAYEHDSPHMGGYGYGGGETEARRRRDRRGRYMMGGSPHMMDDGYEDEYEPQGYRPQMNGGSRYGFGDVYAEVYAPNAMNRPMGGGMMGMHGGMAGMHGGDMSQPVDEHTAKMWVQKMDGGEHFKLEQTEQQRMPVCPDCNKYEFYVAMNAMWNDYCETAKKMNIDRPDYYAHLAKDFLKDKDAKPHKLRRYMEHIAA